MTDQPETRHRDGGGVIDPTDPMWRDLATLTRADRSATGIMRALILAAMAFVMLMAVEARAADEKGQYSTVNAYTCPQYLEGRRGTNLGNQRIVQSWVSGYITAVNLNLLNTYDIMGGADYHAAFVWLENWCRSNPFKSMADGMNDFVIERHPHRLKTAPK